MIIQILLLKVINYLIIVIYQNRFDTYSSLVNEDKSSGNGLTILVMIIIGVLLLYPYENRGVSKKRIFLGIGWIIFCFYLLGTI